MGSPGSAGGSSGGEHGGSGGGGGSGSGGTSGGSGSGGGGGGKQGGSNNGSGDPTFTIAGINVGGGMQLPFPFFPPFGCDIDCQPIQIQFIQQKQQTQLPMITTPAAPPSSKRHQFINSAMVGKRIHARYGPHSPGRKRFSN